MRKMRSKKFFSKALIFLFLCSIVIISNPNQLHFTKTQPVQASTNSYPSHSIISVTRNSDFSSQGFIGSGLLSDPYIFANYSISLQYSYPAIEIVNTTAYFEIANISITNPSNLTDQPIYLSNVTNGLLNNVTYSNPYSGLDIVQVKASSNIIIENSNLTNAGNNGITILSCSNISLINNIIEYSSNDGIYLDHTNNSIISNNQIIGNTLYGIESPIYSPSLGNHNESITNNLIANNLIAIEQVGNTNMNVTFNTFESNSGTSEIEGGNLVANNTFINEFFYFFSTSINTFTNNTFKLPDPSIVTSDLPNTLNINTFTNNFINGKLFEYIDGQSSITIPQNTGVLLLDNSDHVTIQSQNSVVFMLYSDTNIVIKDSTINSLSLTQVTHCELSNNQIKNGSGVTISNSNNINIAFNSITNTSLGLSFANNSNIVVNGNIIKNNLHYSINTFSATGFNYSLINNRLYDNPIPILDIFSTIYNNTLNNLPILYIDNANNSVITTKASQILVKDSSNIVITNQDLYSLEIINCNYTKALGNRISNDIYGILVSSGSHVELSNNNITNQLFFGILGSNINNITISNDIVNMTFFGIDLTNINNSKISNNMILQSELYAFDITSCNNSVFSGNLITNEGYTSPFAGFSNLYGLDFSYSNNNTLSDNYIQYFSYGVEFNYSNYNSISLNLIDNNTLYGVFCSYSNSNTIYENNFYDNAKTLTSQAEEEYGTNNWFNGSTGNFWNTFTGVDANNDGIGDTPYNITTSNTANNSDKFPLMNPLTINLHLNFTFSGYIFVNSTTPSTTPPSTSSTTPSTSTTSQTSSSSLPSSNTILPSVKTHTTPFSVIFFAFALIALLFIRRIKRRQN